MALINIVNKDTSINRKSITKMIDIDDIKINPRNNHERVLRNLKELEDSIKQNGLLKPLEVYENDEGEYVLIGGERRYTAIKNIIAEDEDFDTEIPCTVLKVLSATDELLKIHMSNAQEELTEEDKIRICRDLLNILEEDPSVKPTGVKTIHWLAPFLGCSARTAQKIKNQVEELDNPQPPKDTDNETEKAPKVSKTKLFKKVVDKLNKIALEIESIEDENFNKQLLTINDTTISFADCLALLTNQISTYSSHLEDGDDKNV